MILEKTWRWFGEGDTIKLSDLRQMGVEGVVTALHHIPNGEVWPVEEIMKVKSKIEKQDMRWSVVESLPVSEGIKVHNSDYNRLIRNYQQSLINLGRCGVDRVCYNFMPVLDWVRTDLHYKLPDGSEVMFFDFTTFVAFDAFILNRPGAEKDYPKDIVEKASRLAVKMSPEEKEKLAYNIIIVTQGFIDGVIDGSVKDYKKLFLDFVDTYRHIDAEKLRQHLSAFLNDVVPVAEKYDIKLCIHPDDPSFPVLGLPRIVSTQDDLEWICDQVDSISNGITFCTGSLSVNRMNNLKAMAAKLAPRIHFVHLRNNAFFPDGSFHESGHIRGDVDLSPIAEILLREQYRRKEDGRTDFHIPFRPDHGLKILDDFNKEANPGYPMTGRLKGMAEMEGLLTGIDYMLPKQG